MPFFRTVLLYCILFRLAMIESFPDCSDCGTYFSIHLRTSVPEQSPGKTVFHQLVQIKICCDKALFLSSHGCLYFPAAVPEIGIKKQVTAYSITCCMCFVFKCLCPFDRQKNGDLNPQFSALLLPGALIDRFTSDVPFALITYACSVSTYKIWAPNPINNVVSHFRLLTRLSVWA